MFEELKKHHYRVILADPPWPGFGQHGMARNPTVPQPIQPTKRAPKDTEHHYPTMLIDDICKLPVKTLAARDCLLLLWVRNTRIPEALKVIEAWGFELKTIGFAWVKFNSKSGTPITGLGHWTRSGIELCLLCRRGRPPRRTSLVPHQVLFARRREHSRKPDEIYGEIEKMIKGPYLELFARQHRSGWDSWGLEVDKFDANK